MTVLLHTISVVPALLSAADSGGGGLNINIPNIPAHGIISDLEDIIVPIGIFLIIFGYLAFRAWQQRQIDLALIEKGQASLIPYLRNRGRRRNPWLSVGTGVAAMLSAVVLHFSHNAAVAHWFIIFGLFFTLWGVAGLLGQKGETPFKGTNQAGEPKEPPLT